MASTSTGEHAKALHILMMTLIALAFLLSWVALLRCLFDGETYQWGRSYFGLSVGGAGLQGDFIVLVLSTALALLLAWTGWRRFDRVFRPLALVAAGALFADAAYAVWAGGAFFEGATLGVAVDIGLWSLVLHALLFGLVVHYATAVPYQVYRPLERANWIVLAIVVALFPLQYALLSVGEGRESRDQLGVLITIGQWFLIHLGLSVAGSRPGDRHG